MFSIFFSEILLKYLDLSWSFLRRSLTFGSVYHLLIFKPKSVVYHLFHKFKMTKPKSLQNNVPKPCENWNFIWLHQKRIHWDGKSIYNCRILFSSNPNTTNLTKFGQSETVPEIFPTQCQAPSTWLSNSGVQIFFQVCRVKLKESVISSNRELRQTPKNELTTIVNELRNFSKR